MKAKTKFEIVAVGIIIVAIGYIAFSSKPQQVEAQRTVVIDGDLYRVSDLFRSERLSNSKDIRMLFEEKNGLMLVGKWFDNSINGDSEKGLDTQLYLYDNGGNSKKIISEKSNVGYAIFDKKAENIFYWTLDTAELYQYNIKSGKNERVATLALPPRLSPDGKGLLYEKVRVVESEPLNDLEIRTPGFAILNIDTREEKIIPNTSLSYSGAPYWTPDSRQILFRSDFLYIINIDGTERTQLTKQGDGVDIVFGGLPLWSPDGRYFIGAGNDNNILLFELDLQNKRIITAGPIAYGTSPRWVEEGKTISVLSLDAKAGAPALSIVNLQGKVLQGDKSHEKEYYSPSKGAFRRVAPKPVLPPLPPESTREIPPGVFHSINTTQSLDIPQKIPTDALKPVTQ